MCHFVSLWYNAIRRDDIKLAKRMINDKIIGVNIIGDYSICENLPGLYHVQSIEMVELLLENGADINHLGTWRTVEGITPIMYMAHWGNFEILKYLVSRGADVNAINRYGERVLDYPKIKNNKETTDYLIGRGAM